MEVGIQAVLISKIKLRFKQARAILALLVFSFVAFFKKPSFWLISERGTEARDNGYCFYKYMVEHHPEKRVYFLITRNSPDYWKVENNAVKYGSLKSYWIIAGAEKIISAHYASIIPPDVGRKVFDLFRLSGKFYFLQHGIIKDNLNVLYAEHSPMRLFVCGAKPEYDDISRNYGHPAGVVKYTGLARFDYLERGGLKNQILIMPTWRTAIKNESDFINSEYYKRWQELLLDHNLAEALEEHKINLVFYVHYEMQKYLHLFKINSRHIIAAQFKDYDIQDLLRESKILVTDFSSVFFDFAYMRKPVIYYQFDKYHYENGYFSYSEDGFGPVCTNNDQVIKALLESMEKKFAVEEIYKRRANYFFPVHDKNNCERIYQAIIEN